MAVETGSVHERSYLVTDEHLAIRFGSGVAPVLSTPALVGFCEETARLLIDGDLDPGEQTVGASIALRHLAPTPAGGRVTVRAELVAADGRTLRFSVLARDEAETIAEGEHVRVIVDAARFAARAEKKRR
jgi:predicted thioesterase